VFSDADHAGDVETRRSTTVWVKMLHGTAAAWGSKLQSVVAKCTTAAKIIAASTAPDEAVYCQKLLRDRGTSSGPMTLRVDNQAALKRMNNEMADGLTGSMATSHMHECENVVSGEVKLVWVETKSNIADILTKPLGGRISSV
jgi:hypothetical protein